jgi:hypothetical protein
MVWRPSRYDRKQHPDLPQEAQIEGRLMTVTRHGFRETVYLFTTLPESWEKVVAWYAQRWNLELDLRTLKGTPALASLAGKEFRGGRKGVADCRGGRAGRLAATTLELHPFLRSVERDDRQTVRGRGHRT